MRTATIKVSVSTNPATAHIGRYFADLRVNGRQKTKVGNAEMINKFIDDVLKHTTRKDIQLTVTDATFKSEYSVNGGVTGIFAPAS